MLMTIFLLDYFQKKLMTTFFKEFKKLYFGVILGSFCPNLGNKEFSWKNRLSQFYNIQIIYRCAELKKKLMTHS